MRRQAQFHPTLTLTPREREQRCPVSGGSPTSGNGLRKEFASTLTTNDDYIVRQEIRNTNGAALRVSTKRYRTFAWGTALVEEVSGTGTASRTNSYTYHANGLPETVFRANGSWEWTV